jgi:predicted TIM-barrel fold metal-dependent hydrolase
MDTFIDAHVHILPWRMMRPEIAARMEAGRDDLDLLCSVMDSPSDFLRLMDREGVEKAAIINYASPEVMGFTEEVNEFCAWYCSQDRSRLIAFGSIDPQVRTGHEKRIDEILEKLRLGGIKIHPCHQAIFPNDYTCGNRSLEYLYGRCEELQVPVMFHTGTSVFEGARNRFADPITIDDVAVDFPRLKIILAHGGRPLWMSTCVFLVRRFPNVYMDISSIPPLRLLEYFPRLEDLSHKVLFGTDWPSPNVRSMRANFDQFLRLGLSGEAVVRIARNNAAKLLTRL